jgi:transposase InsO family protein
MEEKWYAARACLRHLREKHPNWSYKRLAKETGYGYNWVRKWCKRFDEAEADDSQQLRSQSRARKTSCKQVKPEVVTKILTIRDDPPERLKRVPGPEAIKYYLHRDQELKEQGYYLPSSTSTIWGILDENGRIDRPAKRDHEPLSRAAPMESWQIDFKDVTTVVAEPGGKQMHLVESLDVVDCGTSILVDNPARLDYNAETVVESLVEILDRHGCPQRITMDRDPRFVGSWSADGFPSPLMRLLLCAGLEVEICPPRRPDKNAFVERYHRSYQEEAIQIYRPSSFDQVAEMNLDFRQHYNYERPNQALTCGNQPPRLAFANLPSLPPLPDIVDPDCWLEAIDGQIFKRRVDANGTVKVDKHRYYIQRGLKKRTVLLQIDAPNRQFQVLLGQQVIKTIPIKGLHDGPMPFERYLQLIKAEAVSEWRRYLQRAKRYVRLVD